MVVSINNFPDDWEQYKNNPHIEQNKKVTSMFVCKDHPKLGALPANAMANHSKGSHDLTLKGEKIIKKSEAKSKEKEKDAKHVKENGKKLKNDGKENGKNESGTNKDEEPMEESNKPDLDMITELKERIRLLEGEKEDKIEIFKDSENMTSYYIADDISKTATNIAKNIAFQFVFEKCKENAWIPIEWNYEDFINYHVACSLIKVWHIDVHASMDIEKLAPEFKEALKGISKLYIEDYKRQAKTASEA